MTIDELNATKSPLTARFVNLTIDLIIICILFVIVAGVLPTNPVTDSDFGIIAVFLFVIISFIYYVPLEYKFQKSLAKFITGTKVVKCDGKSPTFRDIVVRTICRFIPFDKVSFIFGKKGFHDKFSDTIVVKDLKE